MTLTKDDLQALKQLIDSSIDERVPAIIDARVQPMLDKLEKRLMGKHYELKKSLESLRLDVGKFSLETTDNFMGLRDKIDRSGRALLKT